MKNTKSRTEIEKLELKKNLVTKLVQKNLKGGAIEVLGCPPPVSDLAM